MPKKKIALFHPWIKSRGGAEKVVLEILEKSKHKIDLYTWVYDKENTFKEFKKYKIKVLNPKWGEKISRYHILRGLFFPISIFKKIPLERYDRFLISTSGLAEFVIFRNYKKGKTYGYVYTPLRDANKKIVKWNLKNRYPSKVSKIFYLTSVKIYKFFEKFAWKKFDKVAFISHLSKKRGEEHKLINNKKIEIIYPPVEFSRFNKLKIKDKNYFLYYSRLNPPKRQDLLILAWKKFVKKYPQKKLFIVGTPENKEYCKKLMRLSKSTKNVEILTEVGEKELENLVSNCSVGMFLGYSEDFGIVPLEILSAGKPLIAVNEGGYIDLIKDHKGFYKIKEMHEKDKMVKEIFKALENFSNKKGRKNHKQEIKTNNFIYDIDKFLEN
ncbi:glycosyltransferase family 4 protein [Candidatus Pacearchaeota archaeon]|nr:glycosyltransferase family 4 protein [Candidatus Pacearchaeota archaeon]